MKLTIIGAGNMAEAILKGILDKSVLKASDITLTDVSAERLEYIDKTYKVNTNSSNITAINSATAIIIAVKPQNIDQVLEELHQTAKDQLIISIAAGITIAKIDPETKYKVVRAMPNTPALIGEGATALAFNNNVTDNDKELASKIFNSLGITVVVNEEQLNAVTGLSGSGPAFVFRLIEAFIQAGLSLGLDEETASKLALQTFIGSSKLAADNKKSLEALVEQVSSPNGTTVAGREILESSNIKEKIIETIKRAKERADELSEGK